MQAMQLLDYINKAREGGGTHKFLQCEVVHILSTYADIACIHNRMIYHACVDDGLQGEVMWLYTVRRICRYNV